MTVESKTYDLIRQLQSLASEAEKQAIDEREYTAAIHIARALSSLNEAMDQTTKYQMELAEELVAAWRLGG